MFAQLRGDRRLFKAHSDTDLVDQIRRASFSPDLDLQGYMDLHAKRLRMWDGTVVSTASPNAFVQDLRRVGELRVWTEEIADAG